MAACFKCMPPCTEGGGLHTGMALKANDFGHREPLKRRYRIYPLVFLGFFQLLFYKY